VIEGHTLKHIFQHESMDCDNRWFGTSNQLMDANIKKLVQLTTRCKSVICCRMSPIQKGRIVRMMKGKGSTRKRCLAVGDGANGMYTLLLSQYLLTFVSISIDVTMILEADIGVGISGKEGLQAVRSADYSIARFKFLKRLLLVHGRNSYRRMSLVVQYTMYKSLIIAFCQLLFSFFSAFSGSPLLNTYTLTTYNLLFTAIFPLVFLFDKDVSDEALENIPELYNESRENKLLNLKSLSLWFSYAGFQALFIALCVLGIVNGEYMVGRTGHTMDYWTEGIIVFTIIMTVNFLDIILIMKSWSIISVIISFGSYIAFFTGTALFSSIPIFSGTSTMYMTLAHLLSDPGFYAICILIVTVAMLPLLLYLFSELLPGVSIRPSQFVRNVEVRRKKSERTDTFYKDIRGRLSHLGQYDTDVLFTRSSISSSDSGDEFISLLK
jgi:magnesium-transporting ATPase (P-type)